MFGKHSPPPLRRLLVLFVITTLAPAVSLAWLGWWLVAQDRAVDSQRLQERRDHAVDAGVAALRPLWVVNTERDLIPVKVVGVKNSQFVQKGSNSLSWTRRPRRKAFSKGAVQECLVIEHASFRCNALANQAITLSFKTTVGGEEVSHHLTSEISRFIGGFGGFSFSQGHVVRIYADSSSVIATMRRAVPGAPLGGAFCFASNGASTRCPLMRVAIVDE